MKCIYYRDNVAIVDIAIVAFKNNIDAALRLYAQCRECRYIVIDSANATVFDKTYVGLQYHLILGFTKADTYTIVLQLKNGNGYVNCISNKLTIKDLQANFTMAVKDLIRWPLQLKVGNNLSTTNTLLNAKNKSVNIAGLKNATLYYTTRQLVDGALALPAIDAESFKISDYDAANPGDIKTHKNVLNLDNAESNILTLINLQKVKLIDSNSMTLKQYGAYYLELQFDIDLINDKMFDLTLQQYKYATKQTLSISFANPGELMHKLTKQIMTSANFDLFNKFTWSLKEVYKDDNVDNGATWQLYAYSKEPMSLNELLYSGKSSIEPIMLHDYIELTDNISAMIELTANEDDPMIVTAFDIILNGQLQSFQIDFGKPNDKDLTQLYDTLMQYIEANNLPIELRKGYIDSTDKCKKVLLYSMMQTYVESSAIIGNCIEDIPRYTNSTEYAFINNGSTITVGSDIVCIPDEESYAFAPYDLVWSIYYNKTLIATSNKWLFKHHISKIGNYDIECTIINPRTLEVVKKLNRSVTVSKA